jgi:tetratricopeptide (TPR) repeat protein
MAMRYLTLIGACLMCVVLPASAAQAVSPQAGTQAAYHNLKGLEYFNNGFYQLEPKQRHDEADQYYALAEQEFVRAVGVDPNLADAHRNLARVYFVRKNYAAAAESYHKLTLLEPKDLDAYVQAALAHAELHQFDRGVAELERAKLHTRDREVTAKLDGYIEKLRNAK